MPRTGVCSNGACLCPRFLRMGIHSFKRGAAGAISLGVYAVRGSTRYCCAGQSPVSSASAESMHAGTLGHAMKILIADDHRLVIEAVKAKLSELEPGIEFVLAMSVDELLAGATDE